MATRARFQTAGVLYGRTPEGTQNHHLYCTNVSYVVYKTFFFITVQVIQHLATKHFIAGPGPDQAQSGREGQGLRASRRFAETMGLS